MDGGFPNDKKFKEWMDDPLGRTVRMVLWSLLGACTAFSTVTYNGYGVHVAMDNYFSSPMLLMVCLATHLIFSGYCAQKQGRCGRDPSSLRSPGRESIQAGRHGILAVGRNVAEWFVIVDR